MVVASIANKEQIEGIAILMLGGFLHAAKGEPDSYISAVYGPKCLSMSNTK